MRHPHLSTTVVGIVLAVVALGFWRLIVLYGAWIEGKRQRVHEHAGHPMTTPTGDVVDEDENNG